MHERSIAAQILDQVFHEQAARSLGRVVAVGVELGEFAGIEPVLLELAFTELVAERELGPLRLDLAQVPLTARCDDCGQEFVIERFQFVCSKCASGRVEILRGEDLRLVSLTAERQTPQKEASP